MRTGAQALAALPTRDAALPILASLFMAVQGKHSLSCLAAQLPERYTASGIIRQLPTEIGRRIVERFRNDAGEAVRRFFGTAFGSAESIDFTDGARVVFESGDIVHLRPSGNAPEFRCYTEAASKEGAARLNSIALDIVRNTIRPEMETEA